MIKAITGTKDILPSEIPNWYNLEDVVKNIMNSFNYKEIRTPIFEETRLFSRGIGEATDIVSKEMYTFIDRSETSVTLKPEMTASVVRALLEHSLDKQFQLNKLFYISPMFRQERPQAGRFRQFHQFGAEALGSTSPALDAEMIILAYQILKKLGLSNFVVKINSLGIPSSRENYKNLLKEYLVDKKQNLSEESQKRYETNILRLFDSKDERDQKIMENAPLLIEHLDDESLEHFDEVKQMLLAAGIPFEVDPKLVRGLDYYTHTTFELVSGSVGSQSALCGGGRYDLLVNQLGERDVPGIGFAAGIERILLAMENEKVITEIKPQIDFYIVRLEKELNKKVFEIATKLRENNSVEFDYTQRSVKAQMREANRLGAKNVLIIGGEEFERGTAVLKNMEDGSQEEILLSEIK
ncbi:MAG: histidine--tRNA ligase [Bacteroidetes bacterium]|nr:histidine--tRNA ligase [Bacteroidota bacterium]MBU1114309.1 histidine--tRNA ligase [Bacteroidota bacterium]MBU1797087.1 histidine--tRNA ligase [Bacteroidota bacterium]